jgi:uncharacterized protein
MSEENVERVRQGFEALARGDLESVIASMHPDIVWDVSRRQLEPAVYHGRDGVREFLASLSEVWSEQRFEPVEYLDAGDSVVVTMRFVSTSRATGLKVSATAIYVWELRDGQAVRATMFQREDEALRAAGLER